MIHPQAEEGSVLAAAAYRSSIRSTAEGNDEVVKGVLVGVHDEDERHLRGRHEQGV